MLEFHSIYPVIGFSSSHDSSQSAPNFDGSGISYGLLHFSSIFFYRLPLSAHSLMLRNPPVTSPRLLNRTVARYIGPVYQRKIEPLHAQVPKRPQGGKAVGEIGMWGFDGNVYDAADSIGPELCCT
uniref:Uncharacterized protein LOC105637961 n=1 Tax=Rhizophora mucronata TaxID=61149 RepID=A0A2P2J9W1_RHIMU